LLARASSPNRLLDQLDHETHRVELKGHEPEPRGLHALMLLHEARRATRVHDGVLVPGTGSHGRTRQLPRVHRLQPSMTDTWDAIADWYADRIHHGSAMHEFARDVLLEALPSDMSGQRVLDLGCGEGLITRATASRGATVLGIDPTVRLIERAQAVEATAPTGATYRVDDGRMLGTVTDHSMDWVTAGLSLNNVPDLDAAIRSVRRVLVSAGRLAFTVPHPCFEAPHARWVGADRLIGTYATEGPWRSARGVRRAGNHHRTISRYLTALIDHGFALTRIAEPPADPRVVAEQPHRAGLPPFLLVLASSSPKTMR
jgi:SAM-dependent methyltransferase